MSSLIKGEYGDVPFGIIEQSEILTKKDITDLEGLYPELKDTFLKSQVFRTRTEMEISVLDEIRHPTHASKYWQSMREQNVMFTELVMTSYEYRKNRVEMKMLERDLKKEKDSLKKELIQIEIEKKNFLAKSMERMAKDRIREVKAWSEIKDREAKFMSPEELSDVNNHQKISYVKRWILQSLQIPATSSIDERNNLLGQLQSGIKACRDQGILEDVLKDMPLEISSQVRGYLST